VLGLPREIAGTIIAAFIAAVISLLGLLISKENKVSEFRQSWIDALREEIAAVITHAHAIHGAYLAKFSDNQEIWRNMREDFVTMNEAWAKIKLRLNPDEGPSKAILEALQKHESLFLENNTPPDFSKLGEADRELLKCTQVVLKEEWEKVKRGERIYRGATWLAGILVVFGLLFLLLKPSIPLLLDSARRDYRIIERTDNYVDKEGRPASEQLHDHEIVSLVFAHEGHKIYGQCDLSTLNKLDPNASCGLRPIHDYNCVTGRDDVMTAPMPLSDLTCTDADGRKVYVYVSKEE
jgi:hypothetical protein